MFVSYPCYPFLCIFVFNNLKFLKMKVKFGALMVDGRGKAGGSVFSKNRGGSYMKNKTTPTNPRTTAQTMQRQLLGQLAGQWRKFTQDVRNAWKAATADYPKKNIFGDTITLAGNALYNSLNANLAKVNEPPLTLPVSPQGVQDITMLNVTTLSTSQIIIALSDTLGSDNKAVIRATAPFSPGISNFNNKLRDIAVLDSTDGLVANVTNEYISVFGAPIIGQKVAFSFQVVNTNTGQAGVPSVIGDVVA